MSIDMNIKLLSDKATIPTRGSDEAAGYDLYAALDEPVEIKSGKSKIISTDIIMEIPQGTFGGIFPRSGLATKEGLRTSNCVGVVDADYRGVVGVALYNDSPVTRIISPKQRIAQLILIPSETVELNVVDELTDTVRGDGGFGSSGR